VFALRSVVHSYLILRYAEGDKVAMNVASISGQRCGSPHRNRLSGALALYQWQGLEACLWASATFVLAAGLLSQLVARRDCSAPPQGGSHCAVGGQTSWLTRPPALAHDDPHSGGNTRLGI
jgi:hypothetical protein